MTTALRRRFHVILAHPQKPENIGLVARAMKNTGFNNLRVVGPDGFDRKSFVTAVHAQEILEGARFFPDLRTASADLNLILASTSRRRKNFPLLPLEEACDKVFQFPRTTRVGLLFGNEICGLTSEELSMANFGFVIPQVGSQPSYNLASAVLLTLFTLFKRIPDAAEGVGEKPLPWKEQEESLNLILQKLEEKQFIHKTNRRHVREKIHSLFGRLAMTAKDRDLLLALFAKGQDSLDKKDGAG